MNVCNIIIKLRGFTILESMLGMLLASLLVSVLLVTFIAFKECYQRVMTLAVLQDDGRFAVSILRRNINNAEAVLQVISKNNISATLHRQLNNKSDVLILKKQGEKTAYYLAQASWRQNNRSVTALFEKPLDGNRQELISHVTALHFKNDYDGISYELTLQSQTPVLRFIKKFVNGFISRKWYGFAAVGIDHDL